MLLHVPDEGAVRRPTPRPDVLIQQSRLCLGRILDFADVHPAGLHFHKRLAVFHPHRCVSGGRREKTAEVAPDGTTVTLNVKPLAGNCRAVIVHLPDGTTRRIASQQGGTVRFAVGSS